jgi:hypothetical protein
MVDEYVRLVYAFCGQRTEDDPRYADPCARSGRYGRRAAADTVATLSEKPSLSGQADRDVRK